MRGVPRERRAISRAPSSVRSTPSSRAARRTTCSELLDSVEVEPDRNSEAVAERRRQQPLPRRRADQSEARKVDPDRSRRRPLADHQVERAVLHRRIEHFLDRGIEPVDLVDEQDVAVFEIGKKRGEVAGLGDHRPGGGAETDAHLPRQDSCKRRLAKARRPVEQDVVERFAPALRGMNEDPQVLARRLLPDELVEALRAKRRVGVLGRSLGRRDSGGIGRHPPLIRRWIALRQAGVNGRSPQGRVEMDLDRRSMIDRNRRFDHRSSCRSPTEAAAWYSNAVVIDGLGGIGDPYSPDDQLRLSDRAWTEMRSTGVTAVRDTLLPVGNVADAWDQFKKNLADYHSVLRANPERLKLVEKAADILDCRKENKFGMHFRDSRHRNGWPCA